MTRDEIIRRVKPFIYRAKEGATPHEQDKADAALLWEDLEAETSFDFWKDEHDRVVGERDHLEAKVDDLRNEIDDLESQVGDMEDELASQRQDPFHEPMPTHVANALVRADLLLYNEAHAMTVHELLDWLTE